MPRARRGRGCWGYLTSVLLTSDSLAVPACRTRSLWCGDGDGRAGPAGGDGAAAHRGAPHPGPGEVPGRPDRLPRPAGRRDIDGLRAPKEERAALVAGAPEKFRLPGASDLRYNWVEVRLDAIDGSELPELVIEAWRMVAPRRVTASYDVAP
ncbi:MAG TPA: hypothetical protein VK453_10595 [Micromonosporaceae bacterium]|nr:hypothetical protein [Micromonosporaceae bacterium]